MRCMHAVACSVCESRIPHPPHNLYPPPLTPQAVQGEPLAVGALLDVLSGGHEVLRNEVLLLLSCLLPGAPELAKLVVFEGGFDRLLDIARWAWAVGMHGCATTGVWRPATQTPDPPPPPLQIPREEGLGAPGAPASLVAADCLDLGAALVRDNPATLRMLWGTGHLSPLLGLLPGDAADPILPALLRLVAAAAGPSQAVSRQGSGLGGGAETRQHVLAAALAAGWLPRLLALGLGSCLGTEPAHDQQQAEVGPEVWYFLCLQGQGVLCMETHNEELRMPCWHSMGV